MKMAKTVLDFEDALQARDSKMHWHPTLLKKKIFTHLDLHDFLHGNSYTRLIEFIGVLGESVKGDHNVSLANSKLSFLSELLDQMQSLVGFNLDNQTGSRYLGIYFIFRYGNPKFRDWHSKAVQIVESSTLLSMEFCEYFLASFGNLERLDYGTGHELHFICSLYCLAQELALNSTELSFLVLVLFRKYLVLVHLLLKTYLLEPAGSHGVWGLDDYHFLPYLFGSSQAIGHPNLQTKSIFNPDAIDEFKERNLYFMMIAFLKETKRFSLKWNSPMLNDISQINDWSRVYAGLLKMYKGEILGKLPIMQHFLFGAAFEFEPNQDRKPEEEIVVHEFQPCCANIKIPSIYFCESKEMPYD